MRVIGSADHSRRMASGDLCFGRGISRPSRRGCARLPDTQRVSGLSGLELQRRASTICPHIPTIFLSAKGDIRMTVEAMKAGAVGFLTKPFRDDELLSAVREAFERSRVVVAKKAEKQAIQRCCASLSIRQRQVMTLVSSGLINKQIAAELGIGEVNRKGPPRPGDAEDAGQLARGSGETGREAWISQRPLSDDS
jgi:FixJ family two-component response regulator